ncbi:extracellular solute-binding protein [Thorsellia anophelis]|uniref:Putrescine-binding periplasmic protein n=1 Tax=Thorsellia anophelis DSM 18579 TaxID=1123402 RepID=A0A1I0CJS3_9GAMM|nr:putrescine transport system substrate-binding protein [Thorsellia anophelis DSM 18579]
MTFKTQFKFVLIASLFSTSFISTSMFANEQRVLNIYNWSDFIAPNTIADFEKQSGIKVTYDRFDSNEVLESKLMAGNTGFDLVIPSSNFLARQLEMGIYQPLDKSQIPNWDNFDPQLLSLVSQHDPDNKYAFPYLWSTTGIGYNVEQVKTVLGEDAPLNSWDMVFNIDNAKKLSECGMVWVNDPTEIIASALHYLGHDPNTTDIKAYEEAKNLLISLRPYVRYIHSSTFINDLANGDICAVIGWGGDVLQAGRRAKEANNNVEINYFVPKEGAVAFFDVFAIPKDAKNVKEAHEFLNYIADPEVIANIANFVYYANPNLNATPYLSDSLKTHQGINLSDEVRANLFTLNVQPPKVERAITRMWTEIVTSK